MNIEIQILRAAIAAARYPPGADIPFRAALGVVVVAQEADQMTWKLKQVEWLTRQGCGKGRDFSQPLPSLPVTRSAPDALGPQALTWDGDSPATFRIQVFHPPRAAAAEVKGSFNEKSSWETQWAAPQLVF